MLEVEGFRRTFSNPGMCLVIIIYIVLKTKLFDLFLTLTYFFKENFSYLNTLSIEKKISELYFTMISKL